MRTIGAKSGEDTGLAREIARSLDGRPRGREDLLLALGHGVQIEHSVAMNVYAAGAL